MRACASLMRDEFVFAPTRIRHDLPNRLWRTLGAWRAVRKRPKSLDAQLCAVAGLYATSDCGERKQRLLCAGRVSQVLMVREDTLLGLKHYLRKGCEAVPTPRAKQAYIVAWRARHSARCPLAS